MTPLMMLALTLPPSVAFVLERWMRGREEQARALATDQALHLDILKQKMSGLITACELLNNTQRTHTDKIDMLSMRSDTHELSIKHDHDDVRQHGEQLKQLAEQLTTLQESVYRT